MGRKWNGTRKKEEGKGKEMRWGGSRGEMKRKWGGNGAEPERKRKEKGNK